MAEPLYQQIADDITRQIQSGVLKPGDKLPSTSQLCAQYEVSSTVIRFVMFRLKERGLVYGQPGRGVYVKQPDWPDRAGSTTVSEAAYLRVARDIREQISSGQLKPGDKLPSFAALCEHYDVSNTVIRAAMLLLKAEGLIDGRQGKGVYV